MFSSFYSVIQVLLVTNSVCGCCWIRNARMVSTYFNSYVSIYTYLRLAIMTSEEQKALDKLFALIPCLKAFFCFFFCCCCCCWWCFCLFFIYFVLASLETGDADTDKILAQFKGVSRLNLEYLNRLFVLSFEIFCLKFLGLIQSVGVFKRLKHLVQLKTAGLMLSLVSFDRTSVPKLIICLFQTI